MEELKSGIEILPGLICRLLDETDLPKVNELIANSYSYQHPMRQIFSITKEDIGDYDDRAAKEILKSNASLGTFVKGTDELIAVEMHTIHDVTEKDSHFNQPASERLSFFRRFVKHVLGEVFADLNTNRYIYGCMACVRSDYRSHGVFSGLEEMRLSLGKARGCEYFVAVAGSLYSQMTAKSAGYTVLRDISYSDYIDPQTGLKPDLNLSPIHNSCQLVYKNIPNASET